ncbi:MAG: heparinase II/III-family protein [Clostridia bacterium]|nr:heparinase II/III-family protein [Clostridia bacterium]
MENGVKKHKKGKIIFLAVAVAVIVAFIVTGAGKMLVDTAAMGLDYISLKPNPTKVTTQDIKAVMEKKTASRVFVLATDEDFARVKKNYEKRNDKKLNEYFDYVKKCADKLLDTQPLGYILDDEEDSILETAREILERVVSLSFMWRMTGDSAYAERCVAEMENACNFPDWHEWHFLDTAELTFAVSLGTNWLYDYLDEQQTKSFADAVYEKAFAVSEGKFLSQNWWKWSKTNWNSVCFSGLGIGAMVFYDYYPDFAADFLAEAYKKTAYNFETFTPDGVYVEGSGYWEYCTTYLTYFMSTSDNLLNTDFGLSETDGFLQLGAFPLYVTGAEGVFNYGDNKRVSVGAPSMFWFSKKTDDPATAYYQARASVESELANGKGEYELSRECAVGALWYDGELLKGLEKKELPLSVYLKSDSSQELAAFRSGFFGEKDTYAAIKGGYNYTNHGDLDIGTFVFDSMGERWAEDLGPADYGDSGYFVGIIGGGRWKVYAKRAEGQNTLVFNPGTMYEDQYPFARAGFTSYEEDKENGGTAVLDMTEAYCFKGVKSAERTFEMYNRRTCLMVKDEFTCRKNSEVYWLMHTKADIDISDSRHAVLTFGEKKMNAFLSDDSAGEFEVLKAESFVDGTDNRLKGDWDGIKVLAVHAENVKSGIIEVHLEPAK